MKAPCRFTLSIYSVLLVVITLGSALMVNAQSCPNRDPEVKRQRRILKFVDPDDKSMLWREHLSKQIQSRDWTPKQRSLIKQAFSLATPAMYRNPIHTDKLDPNSPVALFLKAIPIEFSDADRISLFYRVEPGTLNAYASKRPLILRKVSSDVSFQDCDCNTNDDCANSGGGEELHCPCKKNPFGGTCAGVPGCGGVISTYCTGICSCGLPEDN
jgi:hypothetical protein